MPIELLWHTPGKRSILAMVTEMARHVQAIEEQR
jgi:hypothetical protein